MFVPFRDHCYLFSMGKGRHFEASYHCKSVESELVSIHSKAESDFLFGPICPALWHGFFANFEAAYELRDISLYEQLLDSSFTFTYFDFDIQVERQWGFSQEIESTRRLFQNAGLIQLQWNQIISQTLFEDSTQARIVRSFSLTINLEGGDVFRGDGNVNFILSRVAEGQAWKLLRWRDESEL